jgi:uncharacterized protein involved in exopolysaccharide biosynthesis
MVAVTAQEQESEISLYQLVAVLSARRWLILCITALTTLVAGALALTVQKRYQASVIVSPVSSSESSSQMGTLSSLTSQFSGLASLAGVSVSGDSKKFEALAVLQSEALTERFVQQNDLLPVLYQKQWDSVAKRWKQSDPEKVPTLWKANRFFKNKIRTLNNDSKTGLATLTITWKDPQLAARWANQLVELANNYLRDKATRESERNIAYLTEQASKTDVVGVRQAIYSLLQNEINKEMLARGNNEYALKVVDPAFAPELPSSPQLILWLIVGFFGGLLAAVFVTLIRNSWQKNKNMRY